MTSRSTPKRIVHIGFGAFHRGHQLVYAQALKANNPDWDWQYTEMSLFSTGDIEQLRRQDHQFHVLQQSHTGTELTTIDVIDKSLHPKLDGLDAVLDTLADKSTRIVSLTITEKGYGLVAGEQTLDVNNPNIQHDIAHLNQAKTAIGVLVAGLQRRAAGHGLGVTLLSCDNLPHNGKLLKQAVLSFAALVDEQLAEWVQKYVSFPSCMVDRIVPAMTADSRGQLQQAIDAQAATTAEPDQCGVVCETFGQWVIEDQFVAGRPDWASVGVELVDDVTAYENMKLRMLNGSHSMIAYLGCIGGFETVSDTLAQANVEAAIRQFMMKEQAPTLAMPEGVDIAAYAEQLIARFANPHLRHKTAQIAMDGSQKLPQRLFAPLDENIRAGQFGYFQAATLAFWLRYVLRQEPNGAPMRVSDPMAAEFEAIINTHGTGVSAARAVLSLPQFLPNSLLGNTALIDQVIDLFNLLAPETIQQQLPAVITDGLSNVLMASVSPEDETVSS